MSVKKQWLLLKGLPARVRISMWALIRFLYFHPGYAFLAAAISIVFYEIIFWLLNVGLAQYLLTSPFLTLGDKLELVIGSYTGIFSPPFARLAVTLFAVSVLQGIAVAAIIYIMRRERAVSGGMAKQLGGTGAAGLFAVLGLGCAACGTSLITPLLTFFFASSSIALAEAVGFYAALIALAASVVTVYTTGYRLAFRLVT